MNIFFTQMNCASVPFWILLHANECSIIVNCGSINVIAFSVDAIEVHLNGLINFVLLMFSRLALMKFVKPYWNLNNRYR